MLRGLVWTIALLILQGYTEGHQELFSSHNATSAAGAAVSSAYNNNPGYKLAIVILASGHNNDVLSRIVTHVRTQLLPWTPGDVLVFHTGELSAPSIQTPLQLIIPQLQFHRVPIEYWSLPAGLRKEDASSWSYAKCCPFHGIGYRHMSRWYSNGVFKYLYRLGYQWILRLDEDSEIITPIQQNIVRWMQVHKKQYGYRAEDNDGVEVTLGLPELTAWFLVKNKMKPQYLFDSCRPRSSAGLNSVGGWNQMVIYNNFFIANVSWWMSRPVQDYVREVDASNGHYLFRWGDAPVHTFVVKMFLQRTQVHVFGFGYRHKAWYDPERRYTTFSMREVPP